VTRRTWKNGGSWYSMPRSRHIGRTYFDARRSECRGRSGNRWCLHGRQPCPGDRARSRHGAANRAQAPLGMHGVEARERPRRARQERPQQVHRRPHRCTHAGDWTLRAEAERGCEAKGRVTARSRRRARSGALDLELQAAVEPVQPRRARHVVGGLQLRARPGTRPPVSAQPDTPDRCRAMPVAGDATSQHGRAPGPLERA